MRSCGRRSRPRRRLRVAPSPMWWWWRCGGMSAHTDDRSPDELWRGSVHRRRHKTGRAVVGQPPSAGLCVTGRRRDCPVWSRLAVVPVVLCGAGGCAAGVVGVPPPGTWADGAEHVGQVAVEVLAGGEVAGLPADEGEAGGEAVAFGVAVGDPVGGLMQPVGDGGPGWCGHAEPHSGYSSRNRMPGLARRFGLWWTLQPAASAWSVSRPTHSMGGVNAGTTPVGWTVCVCAPMTTQSNI